MSLNTNASETSFASEQSCAKLSFNIIAFNRYSASKSLHLPINQQLSQLLETLTAIFLQEWLDPCKGGGEMTNRKRFVTPPPPYAFAALIDEYQIACN